jgi:hypothetical protein
MEQRGPHVSRGLDHGKAPLLHGICYAQIVIRVGELGRRYEGNERVSRLAAPGGGVSFW